MPQTDDADRFLVECIRGGDQRAWQRLIDRYQGRLMAFARLRLHGEAEAEDAVQETFLGFLTSLPCFDAERSLETYLFAILRYKFREALVKRQRQPGRSIGFDVDEDSSMPFEPAVNETPSRRVAGRERTERQEEILAGILRRLIEEFRDRDKLDDLEVIELLFFVGLRNKEAAERLDRDEKAVAGVKFRAIARLQEYLEELGHEDRNLVSDEEWSADTTIARVWRRQRLSCLKRGTIGQYLLGVLEEPWFSYTRFHLEIVGCAVCTANRDDLAAESTDAASSDRGERLFQSSVGFLSSPAG